MRRAPDRGGQNQWAATAKTGLDQWLTYDCIYRDISLQSYSCNCADQTTSVCMRTSITMRLFVFDVLSCIYSRDPLSSSWWSLGLEDDIICASYLWVREWLCRPILDLQSRAQSGHWNFAFVAGTEAAKWRRSLADCA